LYDGAQKIDAWPGEDYPGTSVRAGAQMLRSWGVISSFRWAWDADTVVHALLTTGPVVVGTWWYTDMFTPIKDKTNGKMMIRASGSKAGGHAYLLNGVNIDKGLIRVKNSWSQEWGANGHAWISISDMDKLIKDSGEACLAVEVAT
jgi:hypothetical protein